MTIKTPADSSGSLSISAYAEMFLIQAAVRRIREEGVNDFLLNLIEERAERVKVIASGMTHWAWRRSKAAHAAKRAKAEARRVLDNAETLRVLTAERARQRHGYLKRASGRTGLTIKQLTKLLKTRP